MKKLFYIFVSAIVALGAVACNNEIDESIEANQSKDSVSFTVAYDDELTRIAIGELDEATMKHAITFEAGDVIYAENADLKAFTFTTEDGKTFYCNTNNADGQKPVEMVGEELRFYTNIKPDSWEGANGIVLNTKHTFMNAEDEKIVLSLMAPVLKFISTEDNVVLKASKYIFGKGTEIFDSFAVTPSEEVQYVPFTDAGLITLQYAINGEVIKTIEKNFENKIYNLGFLGSAVAVVNGKNYTELDAAIKAVEDGGTVTLAADLTFNEDNYHDFGDGWKDGYYYEGDKSFTIDLNGMTVTNTSAVNDYLLNFKNNGTKPNTITIKNGTLEAGVTAYSAISTSTSSTQKITLNLENVTISNNNSNGAAVKARGGVELNVKAGTVITGKNSYVGIEAVGSATVVNIYDGAELYQNGTGSYVGSLAGVSCGATLNVKGGEGVSKQGGFIAMTSGGTINIEGGEWTANGDGTYANGNRSVLIAQNDPNERGYTTHSIINVSGGTFKGGFNCYSLTGGYSEINIVAGSYNADPSSYVEYEYKAVKNDVTGMWDVVKKVPVAQVGDDTTTIYETLDAAFKAAAALNTEVTVTIIKTDEPFANFPAEELTAKVTVEAKGATFLAGSMNAKGATIKEANFTFETAIANGSTVYGNFENCYFKGNNVFVDGKAGQMVYFKDCTFEDLTSTRALEGYTFTIDGMADGVTEAYIVAENCKFIGWRNYFKAITKVTLNNCQFEGDKLVNTYVSLDMTECSINGRLGIYGGHANLTKNTLEGRALTFDDIFASTYDFTATVDGVDYTYVASADSLKKAIEEATEGSNIVLANGTYEGLFFVEGKSLNIFAKSSRKATINGKLAIAASGKTLNISGLKFRNSYTGSVTTGHQYVDKNTGRYIISLYCGSVNVDDCEFTLSDNGAIYFYAVNAPEYCTVTNSKFNCNGFRPILSKAWLTVDNCEFIDQYKYAVQLYGNQTPEGKVVFTNNTITKAGKTSGKANEEYMVSAMSISKSYSIENVEFEISGNTEMNYLYDLEDKYLVKVETFDMTKAQGIEWYPEGGNVAAKIGVKYFQTVQKALNGVTDGGTITLLNGTHNFGALTYPVSSVKFVGEDKAKTIVNMDKSTYLTGKSVSFENLSYTTPADLAYTEQAFGFVHHADNFNFTNCNIERVRLNVNNAVIDGCNFAINTNSGFDGYALYYYGNNNSKVVVKNSKFDTAGKAICVYNESNIKYDLTVENNTFISKNLSTDKYAISIHTELGIYGDLRINGENKVEGFPGLYREFKNNGSNENTNNFTIWKDGQKQSIAGGFGIEGADGSDVTWN